MSRRQRLMRAASDFLLAMSLGLVAYWGITTAAGAHAQHQLRDKVTSVSAFSADVPRGGTGDGGTALDFSGWEEDERYWHGLGEGDVFGRLVIPAIDLDVLVVKGASEVSLRRGPGWIEWTDLPGPYGTCGIAGHRTTYGAPFRRLEELSAGDTIDLYSPYRLYRYTVTSALVVPPSQVDVVAPTEHPSLALTACHPPYSARYRLAVRADLTEVRRFPR